MARFSFSARQRSHTALLLADLTQIRATKRGAWLCSWKINQAGNGEKVLTLDMASAWPTLAVGYLIFTLNVPQNNFLVYPFISPCGLGVAQMHKYGQWKTGYK